MKAKNPIGNHFRGVHYRFSRLHVIFMTEIGLTAPQYALLYVLYNSGPMRMKDASRQLHLTKPAITYLTDHLEKKKFLKRAPDSRDRRVYQLELLPKGQKVVLKAQKMALRLLMENLKTFTVTEQKVIGQFYQRLSGRIDLMLTEKERGQ